jgi:hypothetical protein
VYGITRWPWGTVFFQLPIAVISIVDHPLGSPSHDNVMIIPYLRPRCALDSRPEGVDSGPEGVDSGPEGVNSGPEGVNSGPKGVDSGPEGVDSGPEEVDSGSLPSAWLCSSWCTAGTPARSLHPAPEQRRRDRWRAYLRPGCAPARVLQERQLVVCTPHRSDVVATSGVTDDVTRGVPGEVRGPEAAARGRHLGAEEVGAGGTLEGALRQVDGGLCHAGHMRAHGDDL